jgi:hypothetical protein
MVNSVTTAPKFTPTDYLSQLANNKPFTAVANTGTTTPVTPVKPATTATPTPSLSQNNLLGLSTNVLSLLQGTSASSASGGLVSELVGSASTSGNPVSGVLSSLLTLSSSTQPAQVAIAASAGTKSSGTSGVQSLINSYNSVNNANNATLIKNSQSVLNQGTSLLA